MKPMRLLFWASKPWTWLVAICLLTFAQASAQSPTPTTPSVATPAIDIATVTPAPTTSPVERGRVLYPANGVAPTPVLARGNGEAAGLPGLAMSFLMLLALCAGGYYLLRRQSGFTPVGKGQRKLVVSESRSLGNRQFLVVVEYESERILIGVTPGKIDYLCPLPNANPAAETVFKERVS